MLPTRVLGTSNASCSLVYKNQVGCNSGMAGASQKYPSELSHPSQSLLRRGAMPERVSVFLFVRVGVMVSELSPAGARLVAANTAKVLGLQEFVAGI